MLRQALFCFGGSLITTPSVSERAAASVAEWDELVAMLGGFCWVLFGFVEACSCVSFQATTPVQARFPIDAGGVGCIEVR